MQNVRPVYFIRFFCEVAVLVFLFLWAKSGFQGWLGVSAGLVLALIAALIWGVFNVPGDESRSGNAPVVVPGWLRLIIEVFFFGLGVAAAYFATGKWPAFILFLFAFGHYFFMKKRLQWLLKN